MHRLNSPVWLSLVRRAACNIIVLLVPSVFAAGAYAAAVPTTLYAFHGKSDGGTPEGGVILGADGVIYGTADRAGLNDNGTVFSLTPPAISGAPWVFKVLHRMAGGAEGGYPLGLTQDNGGDLYGYTLDFGAGYGTVFELRKPAAAGAGWRFQTLYQFKGATDGESPSGLAIQPDGSLIGTTDAGGRGPCQDAFGDPPHGCGTVFQLTPPALKNGAWTETILYRFGGGADGAIPVGAPIAAGGYLYGVTTEGGGGSCGQAGTGVAAGCGSVYRLKKTTTGRWAEKVAYGFPGGAGGSTPVGNLAADARGDLYGATAYGGLDGDSGYGNGVIYKLTPAPGGQLTQTLLHQFTGGGDGYNPQSGVALDQKGGVHGTTYLGPSGYFGMAFVLLPPKAPGGVWREDILAKFSGAQGDYLTGLVAIDPSGASYGVALQGGRFDQGTVYRTSP